MLSTRFPVTIILVSLLLLVSCAREEAYWSAKELRIIQSFQLDNLPPNTNASNRFANNKQAAEFGKHIFFDKRFSLNATISCASCHQSERAFTDGLPKAKGVHETGRNTQSIIGSAYQSWFYWDGRKDSLWAQALVPFEAANEMASNRIQVLNIIGKDNNYRRQYEALFGPFPSLIFQKNLPVNAGPWGDKVTRNNWFRIPQHTQHVINKAYANVGKSVAAYMRSLPIPETRFDSYIKVLLSKGESEANKMLSIDERAGLKLFIYQKKTHCLRCHNGPLLSNSDFHNIGTGSFEGKNLDFGRYLGILALQRDEFNCLGNYSDAKPEACQSLRFLQSNIHEELKGAFKTPSLRNLNKTGPYFHDGRFKSLEEVLQHYLAKPTADSELPQIMLTRQEQQAILAFIGTLDFPD